MKENPIHEARDVADDSKKSDVELYIYYADIISALPRDKRHRELLNMIVELHRDYEKACKLAWELYLAGTGQSNKTFCGTAGDPVEEVIRSRGRLMARGLGIHPEQTVAPDEVRQASKKVGACGPECGEAHTYDAGSCRMFTFGSGYAPGVRDQKETS